MKIGKFLLLLILCLVIIIPTFIYFQSGSEKKMNKTGPLSWEDVNTSNIEEFVKQMSLEEKVGQLLMPAIREWKGQNVTSLSSDLKEYLQQYHIGGVILFRENIETRKQTALLTKQLQELSAVPLFIGVDQEGGIVTRMPFTARMPGNMAVAATRNVGYAKQLGKVLGSELRSVGFNVNFAPVVDINSNYKNPVIGVRSFGDDPELVSEMSIAFLNGLQSTGVIGVAKHYPGHGDVDQDSHFTLPKSEKTLAELREIELQPYKELLKHNLRAVMSAHIMFPNLDSQQLISQKDGQPVHIPATFSGKLINKELRGNLGFKGVVFSDAMNMKAISNHFHPVDAAIYSLKAGVDVILMPEDLDQVYNGLIQAVKDGRLKEDIINQAVKRIIRVKVSQAQADIDHINFTPQAAFDLEEKIVNDSITLLKNREILPFRINDTLKFAIVSDSSLAIKRMKNALKPFEWKVNSILLNQHKNWQGSLTKQEITTVRQSSHVIVVTSTATSLHDPNNDWLLQSYQSLKDIEKPIIVVAARSPYDFIELSYADVFIAQYDIGTTSFKATAEVLFGERKAKGKLPVSLPNQ